MQSVRHTIYMKEKKGKSYKTEKRKGQKVAQKAGSRWANVPGSARARAGPAKGHSRRSPTAAAAVASMFVFSLQISFDVF